MPPAAPWPLVHCMLLCNLWQVPCPSIHTFGQSHRRQNTGCLLWSLIEGTSGDEGTALRGEGLKKIKPLELDDARPFWLGSVRLIQCLF